MISSVFPIATLFFCLSAILVFDLVWLLLKSPLIRFFTDKPGTRKIHQQTIPRAGGMCIAFVFCGMLCLWKFWAFGGFTQLPPRCFEICLVIAAGMFVVGFFDDTTSFAILNKAKFLLEFVIAAEVVYLFGIKFPEINFFGIVAIKNEALLSVISIFWMVGVANALNIIDGLDGLAGTFVCISFTAVAILAAHAHADAVAILSIIIVGCTIGFLIHNVSPARVFLGDTGSLFLGMMLALFLMYMAARPREPFSIYTALLIAGYPILDVAVAIGRRLFKSMLAGSGWIRSFRAIAVADSEHTHHRLVYRGLSHSQAALIVATLSATLCVTAIYTYLFSEFKIALVVYMFIVVSLFLYELNFFDRLIIYIRYILHRTSKKQPYRIGVVDADPILHHALIRFKQRKFSFDFFSHQDLLKSRDAIEKLQLQAITNGDEQFFVTATWASDTRKYSRDMIRSVINEWARGPEMETGQDAALPASEGARRAQPTPNSQHHSVFLINCRHEDELDVKVDLGLRLLANMDCDVILATDTLPAAANTRTNRVSEIIFLKKPFYIPVFFQELFRLTKHREDGRPSRFKAGDTLVMRRIEG
jgi:UDP-GlcNAc:undecaprenyl-phosphate GlcNAc-1-phosphate transferase